MKTAGKHFQTNQGDKITKNSSEIIAGKLVYHYTVYHLIGKISKCTLCDKWVPDTSNMVRHLNHHFNESEFTCTNCGAGFKTNRGLKIHLLAHSDPKTELFHCTKCPNIFIAKARFKDHMEKHVSTDGSADGILVYVTILFTETTWTHS